MYSNTLQYCEKAWAGRYGRVFVFQAALPCMKAGNEEICLRFTVLTAGKLQKIGNPDEQIIINPRFYHVVKGKLHGIALSVKRIDLHGFFHGVHNPILADARNAVAEQLNKIIHALGSCGDHFDNPVGGSVTAFGSELFLVADDGDIRFNIGCVVPA